MTIFHVLSLFPDFIKSGSGFSILKRAQNNNLIEIINWDLREFGVGKHKNVDDTPYGGGEGMILRYDVVSNAIEKIKKVHKNLYIILLTPQGKLFDQQLCSKLLKLNQDILLICGHYEGFDERIRSFVNLELSIGNYVLSGGELPALVIIDAISRLIPGVLGNKLSTSIETHSFVDPDSRKYLIEYPQYTKPETYNEISVPEILLSGDHNKIAKWRLEQARDKTAKLKLDNKPENV